MKDYGYAWAGVLPAGQEAAEKAMEKGCEVYRLYSDNTEGLCVDAKEIADHAAKGGMLGISKESWMVALEKENYEYRKNDCDFPAGSIPPDAQGLSGRNEH